MAFRRTATIGSYTRPKNRFLKIFLIVFFAIILGVGFWLGSIFYRSVNKITADSGKNGFFSIFDSGSDIKGKSDGRTNILLLGNGGTNHPGGGLSDTMIVVSINWESKKIAMISVPRDLWVQVPNYGYTKINAAFSYGNQNPKTTGGGGKVSSDVISEVLGIPIHYYISIDFAGFEKIVDEVGGVDVMVEKDLYDPYFPADNMIDYEPFRIKAGLQHMNGETALKYARSRETTSDFDRSKRQELVLVAVKEKILSSETLSNPIKITDLFNILGDHVRTSLSVGEIKSLWNEAKGIDTQNITNKVLDTSPNMPLTALQDERGYIIVPKKGIGNYTDLHKIAQNIFSETQQAPELKVSVLNGTKKEGLATQISQLLQSYGYEIYYVGNASTQTAQTTIYNCDGLAATTSVADLAKTLNAKISTKTSCGGADIQIVMGQDSL